MTSTTTSPARALAKQGVTERTFAWHAPAANDRLRWFVEGVAAAFVAAGYESRAVARPDVQVVLHAVDLDQPRPYRRRHAPTFVVAMAEVPGGPTDRLRVG